MDRLVLLVKSAERFSAIDPQTPCNIIMHEKSTHWDNIQFCVIMIRNEI